MSPVPLVADTVALFRAVPNRRPPSLLYRWYLSGVAPVIVSDRDTVTWLTPLPSDLGPDGEATFTHVVVLDDTLDAQPPEATEFRVTVQTR